MLQPSATAKSAMPSLSEAVADHGGSSPRYPANIVPRKPLRYNELTKPPRLCDSYPRKASR
jgi:hypothetical protein